LEALVPTQNDNPLDDIKRLLVVLLLKLGATSEEIGLALNMHPGAIRKMIPAQKIKRILKSS
jgi:hypothetical protein